jgi:hypothetical protein
MCISCKDKINAAPWKRHTDTPEHYKIYQILHGLTTGVYTKDEAKDKLKNVDLSDLHEFKDRVRERINDIMKSEVATIVVPVLEQNVTTVDDNNEQDTPKHYRRRRIQESVESTDNVESVEADGLE